eukprot:3543974-Amphidinium_carterae.2
MNFSLPLSWQPLLLHALLVRPTSAAPLAPPELSVAAPPELWAAAPPELPAVAPPELLAAPPELPVAAAPPELLVLRALKVSARSAISGAAPAASLTEALAGFCGMPQRSQSLSLRLVPRLRPEWPSGLSRTCGFRGLVQLLAF